MIKKYLKPKTVPYLGEFVDALFTSLPFLSIYSGLAMSVVLYTAIAKWLLVWLPWMNFIIFMGIMGVLLILILCIAHKFIVPSLWNSRSKKMIHLENKIDELLSMMKNNTSKADTGRADTRRIESMKGQACPYKAILCQEGWCQDCYIYPVRLNGKEKVGEKK